MATLLTVVGSETYQLLENLVFPDKPHEKTYEALKAALSAHLSPKPLLIAQRYRFHMRDQKEGEIVAQFIAELRSLARSCEFDNALQSSLRDRFVCGLRDTATVKKLITVFFFFFFFFFFFTREHILNSYCMKEETDMTDYS